MSRLVEAIEQRYPGRRAIVTSRGITALYLAMTRVRAIHGPGEVVLPATVCPSVALAIAYAGMTPRFCDVELDTCCMSAATVKPVITPQTRALLVVYMFGKTFDIEPMAELARFAGAELIEDLALAAGGTRAGKPIGMTGRYTVLSFSDVKILPGAAGALLVPNAEEAATVRETYESLDERETEEAHRELALSFRNLTHGWYDLLRHGGLRETVNWLKPRAEAFRRLFVHRRTLTPGNEGICVEGLRRLPENAARRRANYEVYERHLEARVDFIRFREQEVCWRMPILMPDHTKQLRAIRAIRAAGSVVSNHYFPVSFLWGDEMTPAAREIGMRAINLAVDGSRANESIESVCRIVHEAYDD